MKKILFILLFSFLLIPNVKAETVDFTPKFVDYTLDQEFTMNANSSIIGQINFLSTQPIDSNFAYADVCTTGNEPTLWITQNVYGSMQPSTKWYKLDTPCMVMGETATVYRQIMYISSSVSGSDSTYGTIYNVAVTGRLFNNTKNYTTYMRILHLGLSNDIPLGEISLQNDMTQTELLRDILDSLSNNDSTMQEVLESNQAIKEQTEKLTEETEKLNDNITSSDTSTSQGNANSFFEGFESDDYGLSDIITMPLDLIRGLTSNTCVALNLTIPFVNKTFQLPCMSSIYRQYFGDFFSLYQTITFGFVAYWVIVKIFALVKGFKDPDDDKVEVLDL